MQGEQVLLACAQIAVAFAGFASIVVLFQHRDDPASWPAYVRHRLRTMIEVSFTALFFSVLPFVPHAFEAQPALTWRVSSAAFVLIEAPHAAWVYLRSRPMVGRGGLSPSFTGAAGAVFLLVLVLQAANALGSSPGFGPYLVAVVWLIAFVGLVFLRLAAFPEPSE